MASGVTVGGTSTSTPAINVPSGGAGTITITNGGNIYGKGGAAGALGHPAIAVASRLADSASPASGMMAVAHSSLIGAAGPGPADLFAAAHMHTALEQTGPRRRASCGAKSAEQRDVDKLFAVADIEMRGGGVYHDSPLGGSLGALYSQIVPS